MNTQELVDQNLKLLLGDLQVQLIFARTRITELEAELSKVDMRGEPQAETVDNANAPETAPNGVDHEEVKKPKRGTQFVG